MFTLKFYFLIIFNINIIVGVQCYYHLNSSVKFTPPGKFQNKSSYFGYSIAYQALPKRLLIGAPKADNNGKLFFCSILYQACDEIHINIKAIRVDPMDKLFYDHNFLLGATVASGQDFSVTCAPRMSSTVDTQIGVYKLGTFGTCYVVKDTANIGKKMLSYKITKMKDTHKTYRTIESVMDGYGWSLFVSNDGSTIVGSPTFDRGILYYKHFSTSPSKVMEPEQDIGYSVIRGNFDNRILNLMAISTPVGATYNGKVIFIENKSFNPIAVINGDTLGSLFGACLCAADIDGDGIDELIVGAPLFVPHNSYENDIGAVYVYKNTMAENLEFTKIKTVVGVKPGSYFGNAIIKVGDLNGDGLQEICVGAPYEDNGHGAVYLYSGSALKTDGNGEYSQRIVSKGLMSFGHSLNALSDYDDNGCNELAVGAPESNTVVLFHCFASIELKLVPSYENVQVLPVNATSFVFYSSFYIKHTPKPMNKKGTIRVKVNIIHEHAKIKNSTNKSLFIYLQKLTNATEYVKKVEVSIPENADYSELIQFRVTAELKDDPMTMPKFDSSSVVLSRNSVLTVSGSIPAARGCNNKCIPNLKMELMTPKNGTIASLQSEFVEIKVTSLGETAFASCIRLTVPEVAVATYPSVCVKSTTHLTCRPKSYLNNGDSWSTGPITLAMQELTSSNKVLNIRAQLYNYCDNTTDYTMQNTLVKLRTDPTQVFVKSTSDHEEIKITSIDLHNETQVKLVNHIYTVTNVGPTIWTNLVAQITIEPDLPDIFKIMKEFLSAPEIKVLKLPKLDRSNKIDVTIPIRIVTKQLDGIINLKNLTLKTTLTVLLDGHRITNSSENLISFQKNIGVPLWIILAAVLTGVLLVLLLVLIFNKMGYFGRKNKTKLENLKRDIRRQTLRQSMVVSALEALKPTTCNASTEDFVEHQVKVEDTEAVVEREWEEEIKKNA